MIVLYAEAGSTVNAELVSRLGAFVQVPAILEGVAAGAGCRFDQLSDPRLHPVVGSVLRPEEIFSAYVATPFLLSVFELDRAGNSLLVSVPWSRVSRVVQQTQEGNVSLSIELDADRSDFVMETRTLDGGSTANGFLRRAGYVLSAPAGDPDAADLVRFAALLRRQLRA